MTTNKLSMLSSAVEATKLKLNDNSNNLQAAVKSLMNAQAVLASEYQGGVGYEDLVNLQAVATKARGEAQESANLDQQLTLALAKARSKLVRETLGAEAAKQVFIETLKSRPKVAKTRKSNVDLAAGPAVVTIPGYQVLDGTKEVHELIYAVSDAMSADTAEDLEARRINNFVGSLVSWAYVLDTAKTLFNKSNKPETKSQCKALIKATVLAFLKARNQAEEKGRHPFNMVAKRTWSSDVPEVQEKVYAAYDLLTTLAPKVMSYEHEVEAFKAVVNGSNVVLFFQGHKATVTPSKLTNLLEVGERVLVVDKEAMKKRNLTELEKVILLNSVGIDLKGMLQNSNLHAVVNMPVGGKKSTSFGNEAKVFVIKNPIKPSDAVKTGQEEWLENFLYSEGMMVCSDAELYKTHGYVQPVCTYMQENAFGPGVKAMSEGQFVIEAYEGIQKLVVRNAKQDKRGKGSKYHETNMDFVVVTAPRSLYLKVQEFLTNPASKAATKDEVETVMALIKSFVAGSGGANIKAREMYGTHRQVGCGVLGQKVVVGRMDVVVHPMFHNLALMDSPVPTVIVGMGSVKAAAFKRDASHFTPVVLENGVEVLVSYVRACDVTITESAMTNAWQKVGQQKLGLEAHTESMNKRILREESVSVMQTVYQLVESAHIPAYEAVERLESEGKLERKSLNSRFNVQTLANIRTQFGKDQVDAVIEAAMRTRKGMRHAAKINKVMEIVEGSVPNCEILEVDLKELAVQIIKASYLYNLTCNKDWSVKVHGMIIGSVLTLLSEADKQWVRIIGEGRTVKVVDPVTGVETEQLAQRSVLIPGGKDLCDSYEATDKGTYYQVSGLLSNLMEELWYFVVQQAGLEEEEFDENLFSISVGEEEYFFNKIEDAVGKFAGKELARVPTYGATLTVVTGYALKENEVHSNVIRSSMNAAEAEYNERVGVVAAKSPTIMANQIRQLKLVELDALAGYSLEYAKKEAILDGTSAYVNAIATVNNGDDADGDLQGYLVLPKSALLAGALGELGYVDPTLNINNPTAVHSREHTESEKEGLFIDLRKAPLNLQSYTVQEVNDALIKVSTEKEKVALNTASQMRVQEQETLVRQDIVAFLDNCIGNGWMPIVADKFAKNFSKTLDKVQFAENLSRFVTFVQGGAGIQLDAMNQMKQADGTINRFTMADMLSPTKLSSLVPTTLEEVAEDPMLRNAAFLAHLEKQGYQLENLDPKKLLVIVNSYKKAKFGDGVGKLASMMGQKEGQYKLAFEFAGLSKMVQKTDMLYFQYFVAACAMWANARVGYRMRTQMSVACQVMRDPNTDSSVQYTSRREAGLENMIAKSVKEIVTYDCVQQQLLDAAAHYIPI